MRELKVRVTAKLINEAKEANSAHCMIAEAIKAEFPHLKYISVDIQTIRFTNPRTDTRYVFLTPRGAQRKIIQFDLGTAPEPFQLRLASPIVVPCDKGRMGRVKQKIRDMSTGKRATASNSIKMTATEGRSSLSIEHVTAKRAPPKGTGQRRQFGMRMFSGEKPLDAA